MVDRIANACIHEKVSKMGDHNGNHGVKFHDHHRLEYDFFEEVTETFPMENKPNERPGDFPGIELKKTETKKGDDEVTEEIDELAKESECRYYNPGPMIYH